MNKRHLHHFWTKLRYVKPWYFLILALISAVICVFALRANNQHMIKLRAVVYTADKNGTDVQGALNKLQAYVTAHMNTNLSTGTSVYPPIQLTYTYQRLVQAQQNANLANNNTQLYTDAQTYCQAQDPVDFSGHNRVPCIIQYVQSHGGNVQPQTVSIPNELYEFSFVSPSWSPDLAGWSLLIAVMSVLLSVLTFAAHWWFRRYVA